MKKTIMILVILWGNSCCTDNSQKSEPNLFSNERSAGKLEDFDSFLDRFVSDSIFQKSRIIFPVPSTLYDIDNEQIDTVIIAQKDWTYSNIISNDYVLKIYKSDKLDTLYIQGKETGVLVKYIFELIDGKWMLVKIIDEST